LLLGLDIGHSIHPFDTPEQRYFKLVKVGVVSLLLY